MTNRSALILGMFVTEAQSQSTFGVFLLALLFRTVACNQKVGVNINSAALKLPTDSTNELRVLRRLPRMIRKSGLINKAKALSRYLSTRRFFVVEQYIVVIRRFERQFRFFNRRLKYFIHTAARLAVLCRSRKLSNGFAVFQAERKLLKELSAPIKEYSALLKHYSYFYRKITVDSNLKKQNSLFPAHKKLTFALRKYLYLKKALSQKNRRTKAQIHHARKSVRLLARVNRPSLPIRKKFGVHFIAATTFFPVISTDFNISAAVSYTDQMFTGFLPEVLLSLIITAVLTLLAIDLGKGILKKELTYESSIAFKTGLLYTSALYTLQLVDGVSFASMFSGYA